MARRPAWLGRLASVAAGPHSGRPAERVQWISTHLIDSLGPHTVDGLTKGAIYALVALGYTLVYGVLRLINFAHSEVFMVGTWAVLGVYTALGVDRRVGHRHGHRAPRCWRWWPRRVASAATALAVERIAYRPLRKKNAPPLIFLITAIGCSLVLVEIFGYVLPVLLRPAVRPGPGQHARSRSQTQGPARPSATSASPTSSSSSSSARS